MCTQSDDDLAVSDWLQEAVWAELGEAVGRLDKAALEEKRPITPRFAKRILRL